MSLMLNRDINSIIYSSYIKLGDISYQLAKNANIGLIGVKEEKLLWKQAIMMYNLLYVISNHIIVTNNQVTSLRGITIQKMNKILSTLKNVAKITDLPIASFIPSKVITQIVIAP